MCGADFIISQMFFDVNVFLTFVQDCRKWGITCPILPGIMCIHAYPGLAKMSFFCKTRIPLEIQRKLHEIRDNDEAVKEFGMEFTTKICQTLLANNDDGVQVLHFYTLNLEKVVYGIMNMLGLALTDTPQGEHVKK
jgi:methylenetetrahydrofolate reductase (NADPH)